MWYYTDAQIRTMYRDALDKKAQIEIISQLEAKPKDLIIQKLESLGEKIEGLEKKSIPNRVVTEIRRSTEIRLWTKEEDDVIRESVLKGLSTKETRELLPERTEEAIAQRRCKLGLNTTRHRKREYIKWTTTDDQILKEAYESGKPIKEISEMFPARSARAIKSRIKNKKWTRGESHENFI